MEGDFFLLPLEQRPVTQSNFFYILGKVKVHSDSIEKFLLIATIQRTTNISFNDLTAISLTSRYRICESEIG